MLPESFADQSEQAADCYTGRIRESFLEEMTWRCDLMEKGEFQTVEMGVTWSFELDDALRSMVKTG